MFAVVILCDLRVKTPEVIQMAGALGIIRCHSVILQMCSPKPREDQRPGTIQRLGWSQGQKFPASRVRAHEVTSAALPPTETSGSSPAGRCDTVSSLQAPGFLPSSLLPFPIGLAS